MLEQLYELLPAILAGLAPSLMALIPVIITSIKNIKINSQVNDLLKIVDDLQNGNITVGKALDLTLGQVNDVKAQVMDAFVSVHEQAKESITKDVSTLQDKIGTQIKSFEMNMAEIQLALKQNIERMMTYENVSTLRQEGQKEVSSE